MRLDEAARTALQEIGSHRTRSALSALSIAIGVAAMVYTGSQISGMSKRFDRATALAGPGRLDIRAKEGHASRGLSPGLTFRDAEHIRRLWPGLHMVYPIATRWGTRMTFKGFKSSDIAVKATTAEWRRRDWVFALRGRFLNDEDVRSGARVCVLIEPGGWIERPFWAKHFQDGVFEKALQRRDMLGRSVSLEDHLFTVVGILKEPPRDRDPRWFRMDWGGGGGTVLVPITTFHHTLARGGSGRSTDSVDSIQVETGDAATAGLFARRVTALLESRHRGEKDFTLRDFREIMQGALQRIRQYAAAILVIGVVAILAGGIGIMNVTLATIYSRVREVGIRRALGATRADILWQFVVEAVVLGLLGGSVGAGLGALAVFYLAPRADRMGEFGLAQAAGSVLVAMATGFLFSIYPAYQASRLDPIEALHYE